MSKDSKQILVSTILIVFGFAAVFALSNFLEKTRVALPENYEDEDLLLQGANLKGFALGFEGLLADWYWMKSLQYIGNKMLNSKQDLNLDDLKPINPKLLYPYLDNTTTLDPQFLAAYRYGAVVLPAIDNELAIKLTEKGIENNPNQWRLYSDLGFIYWRMNEFQKASEAYRKGSEIAGAADFMRLMAAKMKNEGGSREVAREIYTQMFDTAQDEGIKETSRLRLLELDSLDERDAIQKTLDEFKSKNNHCATNWSEIFSLLPKENLPNGKNIRVDKANNIVDPSDAPYILDREKCTVKLDAEKTKIPMH